jgi:hypothetical protein
MDLPDDLDSDDDGPDDVYEVQTDDSAAPFACLQEEVLRDIDDE